MAPMLRRRTPGVTALFAAASAFAPREFARGTNGGVGYGVSGLPSFDS